MTPLGVGFLGAGAATQAIHLPTVAALADRLRVRQVMDVDAAVAARVAACAGARWTTRAADVLSDPDVDIVVVASPAGAHAEQVIAACASGAKAVLCEKPLATSSEEARLILDAARSSGTPVLVGTMHAYDPACRAAVAAWRSAGSQALLVRSRINLPSDDVYIRAATQPLSEPEGRGVAWTEERGTSDEGRGRLQAPRRRAGSTVLTVDEVLFSGRRLTELAVAAASLPQLFRPAAGGGESGRPCDIRVVDASAPSWPGLLARALDTPVRGVLLSSPTVTDAAEVTALAARAERARCRVVVAMAFPYDATVRAGLSRLREEREPLSFIDSIATASGEGGALAPRSALGRAFLAQLAAVRTIIGPVPDLTMSQETDHAYSAAAARDGVTVMLAGLVSSLPAPAVRVDLVGPRRRHTICLAGSSAAPATFRSYGASGMTRPLPSYESGLRSAWRNLHAAVTGAEPVRFGLRELALDLASAGRPAG